MSELRQDVPNTAYLMLAVTGLVALVALGVRLADQAAVRDWLSFGFAGLPRTAEQALSVFLNNARLDAATLVGCAIARTARAGGDSRLERLILRTTVGFCDVVLGLVCVAHIALVGVAIGAYGGRVTSVIAAHGPLELAAFALPLAVYVAARRGPVSWRRIAAAAGVSLALMAAAAVAEVYL
jgi:hypothetical protein